MGNKLFYGFPRQQKPFSQKNKKWRQQCVDFADSKSYMHYSPVRNSIRKKKIDYDLMNGILHMEDLKLILNPENVEAMYIPDNIQHYPIINSKLNVLQGEESARVFDYRVVVTNPNAVSEIENNKKAELLQKLQQWVSDGQEGPESEQALTKIQDYFTYEWQDMREIRVNTLLQHYSKEYNIALMFNSGFSDACTVGEEIYQCDIIGGEPVIYRVNPLKIRVYMSGYSNKIEDADMIVLEDYWSPSKIIDAYYDVLKDKDIKYLESGKYMENSEDSTEGEYELNEFIPKYFIGEDGVATSDEYYWSGNNTDGLSDSPTDYLGNIRVLRVYWKSKRKIKKIKSYNQETGEVEYNFYPETYQVNPVLGEEEEIYWINEAWEGTKIGKDIYVNMRPRPIQYNRLENPSRCHFGIIGSVYNINDNKPFSLVEKMKPYSYAYDVYHDRLNRLLSRNMGNLARMDLSKKPRTWEVDKWLYYAKTMGILFEDSFNEGNYGASTGKLAGALNNNSNGVISTFDGNTIQQYINILEYIKKEMSEVAGISPQREGNISNRETVGGVERATLQSSYITERLYLIHDDVKKRTIECFLETAKIALKGKNKKFQYLLSDGSTKIMEINGDEFAECDYGIVVDNGRGTQELNQKLDMLAQAALQNQLLDFSTIMKLYTSTSLAEKQRMVEANEQRAKEMAQQQQQQQAQLQQQQMEQQAQTAQQQMELNYQMHTEDNETKILVAEINSQAEANRLALMNRDYENGDVNEQAKLAQDWKKFEEQMALEKEKLKAAIDKNRTDAELKRKQINKQSKTITK